MTANTDIWIPLQDIVNCILECCQYPDKWKRAQVKPMPKCNSPTEFKKYRPISLLIHLGKLAEQVIIGKMRDTIDTVISPHQYAYRPGVSTTEALLQFVDDTTQELDKPANKFIQTACLDFSKAFDRLQIVLILMWLH